MFWDYFSMQPFQFCFWKSGTMTAENQSFSQTLWEECVGSRIYNMQHVCIIKGVLWASVPWQRQMRRAGSTALPDEVSSAPVIRPSRTRLALWVAEEVTEESSQVINNHLSSSSLLLHKGHYFSSVANKQIPGWFNHLKHTWQQNCASPKNKHTIQWATRVAVLWEVEVDEILRISKGKIQITSRRRST